MGAALRGDDAVRILYTLATGELASKRTSLLWGAEHLDAEWRDLILQSLEDRSLGWGAGQPPRPGTVDATIAFADYAKRIARGSAG